MLSIIYADTPNKLHTAPASLRRSHIPCIAYPQQHSAVETTHERLDIGCKLYISSWTVAMAICYKQMTTHTTVTSMKMIKRVSAGKRMLLT